MYVARVAMANLAAKRNYEAGFTGELKCRSCGKSQHHDFFTLFMKGDAALKECCENQDLEALKKDAS